jgi:hypothetical protein
MKQSLKNEMSHKGQVPKNATCYLDGPLTRLSGHNYQRKIKAVLCLSKIFM